MLIANVSPRTGGKTTDSGLLAHALLEAEREYELEGYDADHSMQFWDWAQKAEFSFPVHKVATARFHKEVNHPAGRIGIVDCGHTENHPDITDSVLRLADLVIVHMAPTKADFDRVVDPPDATPLDDIITRSAALRADGQKPPTWVLLNRCVTNASSTGYYREEMEAEGYEVFTTTIPRTEVLAQAVSFPVTSVALKPFAALVTEMEKRGLLP